MLSSKHTDTAGDLDWTPKKAQLMYRLGVGTGSEQIFEQLTPQIENRQIVSDFLAQETS
ncbi:MAG: hypothetical protein GY847_39420 [Proteobacteria bacterium]|nr:hypothetical protein [Pseudomonadota bacterium]